MPAPEASPPPANGSQLDLKQVIAMGVGAMVGGGIFSVLGLAIAQAGHAAPLAFALGGCIALLTGYAYARLGLAFHSEGGSFTYLEHAFRSRHIAGLGGWLLLAGYIGTMALYAYTFGVYGTALLGGETPNPAMHHLLESLILLLFLGINLYGVRETGTSELLIVTAKVLILALFAVIGLLNLRADHVLPLFDQAPGGLLMGAALIFVAYEGFELIPNAMHEMRDPARNLTRGIFGSIAITLAIYVLVALVAVGNLTPEQIDRYQEYALAVAAQPFLGEAGFLLIGLAALFSTASAINATLFGTARLASVMAREHSLPQVFGFRRRGNGIPWLSLIIISAVTLLFVNLADLTMISSFASSTFLLIFAAINLSALRLRRQIGIRPLAPALGLAFSLSSWLALGVYLWREQPHSLHWIGGAYLAVALSHLLFSHLRLPTDTAV
ncbi:APC family permease [Thiohalobacter sp. IOR34]|uniref:APC family permease n=1 Tax=Thiohalobacter sp. IOR34 TaxID=3057176 RepID=UPI0025B23E9F|nr:APC family permease [Thiohalobacter sp. IOR34]WJW76355.1 APC family permease [Thiohalobacter sp. IOR34]